MLGSNGSQVTAGSRFITYGGFGSVFAFSFRLGSFVVYPTALGVVESDDGEKAERAESPLAATETVRVERSSVNEESIVVLL